MTDQQHSITPLPELVHQWHKEACRDPYHGGSFFPSKVLAHIATRAAQWGADRELEACCEVIKKRMWFANPTFRLAELRANRRPKSLSLAEEALNQLDTIYIDLSRHCMGFNTDTIRRALERLQELEEQQ